MDGIQVKINTAHKNPTLKLYPDAIMNPGSLYLVDFSNPKGYDGGNTPPANGTLIPNLAWETAKNMIGSGDRTSLSSTAAVNFTAGESIIEFTSKKGLHVITSQAALAAYHTFLAAIPAPIKSYILANTSHRFYYSVWARNTRLALTGTTAFCGFGNTAGFTTNHHAIFQRDNTQPTGGNLVGTRNTAFNALGNFFRNVGVQGFTGTPAAVGSTEGFWKVGSGGAYATFEVNKAPSMILYRPLYIEDLTVSGRSYAEADAADFALYTAAFGAGGRFNGDTFTDPATLA